MRSALEMDLVALASVDLVAQVEQVALAATQRVESTSQ